MPNPTDWGAVPVEEVKKPPPTTDGPAAWGAVPVAGGGGSVNMGDAIAAAGGSQRLFDMREYPNAPTAGHLPLPGVKIPYTGGKDTEGNQGLTWGQKAATLFGPLLTDNPKARQEILAGNLPGATPTTDRFGHPMIEYKGEKYYMSRPGVDAMDVGRVTLATAATVPAVAIAPASVTGAALASGAIAGTQSLAEDALTQAAGGESQKIDPGKAGISAAIATIIPFGLGKVALPVVGRIYAAARSGTPLTDKALVELGLSSDQVASLTPELRDKISSAARQTFGNKTAVGSTYRTELGKEFDTSLTRGEISGDPGQIAKEQTLAGPGNPQAQQTIMDNRATQDQQLSLAQEKLRAQAGGGTPLTPDQAGQVLKQGADAADKQAAAKVDQLYTTAKDPQAVVAAGGAPSAPASHVGQVGSVVRADLSATGPGRAALEDPSLAPNAAKALAQIDRWGQGAQPVSKPTGLLGPNGQPIMTATPGPTQRLDWEAIDNQRKMLLQYRDAAYSPQGTKTDRDAIDTIIDSFDKHFGQLNPLLANARAAHAERMATFKPGGSPDQDKATKATLELLQGPEGGAKVMNTIFGSGVKKGEAIQMIDHLNNNVFPAQPAARDVLKEQALRRLVVDADGDPLSPQKTATAIAKALDGDAEAPLYQRLFSGDELSRLRRFYELQQTLAKSRTPINPPGSGLIVSAVMKRAMGGTVGAGVGAKVGSMFGMPGEGAMAGAAAGDIAQRTIPRVQASRAVNPPANYGQQGLLGAPAMAAGQAAGAANQQQPGPADRLMQNAWGLLGP